ncbi:hypothetical protein DPEC_G00186150 [Dallia pectoralis]|uniref:Uncharacterized protein n=1 Tax=Dallia pectoralis TaxID=75939 RepID=A0ACC2GB85_DALPE|nr:hypothetical protein DPEC_G00186150 [Dallia pectoralis]
MQYEEIGAKKNFPKLKTSSLSLKTYPGQSVHVLGTIKVQVKHKGSSKNSQRWWWLDLGLIYSDDHGSQSWNTAGKKNRRNVHWHALSPHHPSSQSPFSPASPVSLMFPPVLKPVHLAAS